MAEASGIRAGRAFVEIGVNDNTRPGLEQVRARVRSYTAQIAQVQKQAVAATAKGDSVRAERFSTLAAGMEERRETLRQQTAGRAALAARLDDFKIAKAQEADVQRGLADRLYAATHSAREADLRSLRRYYAQIRLEHRGNAQILAQIDRTYAAERQGILSGKGMFGTRAEKRLGKLMAAEGAGMVSPEAGQAAGYAMMASMSGATLAASAGIGAAAASVLVMASGYSKAMENAKELLAVQNAVTNAIQEANDALKDDAPTTDAGQRNRQKIAILEKEAKSVREVWQTATKDSNEVNLGSGLRKTGQWIGSLFGGETDESKAKTASKLFWQLSSQASEAKNQQAKDEQEEQRRIAATNLLALERLRIEGMVNGPVKERLLLEQKHREELIKTQQYMSDHPAAGDLLTPLKQRQVQERTNLELRLQRDAAEELRHAREADQDATINSMQDGFAKELAALREKHKRERAEWEQQEESLDLYLRRRSRQRTEEDTLRRKYAQSIYDIWQAQSDKLSLATGATTQAAIERRELEKQLSVLTDQKDVIKQILAVFDKLQMVNSPFQRIINGLDLQLAVAQGRISQLEADWNQTLRDNQITDPEQQQSLWKWMQATDSAKFVQGEKEAKKTPEERLADYKKKLDDAVGANQLTKAAADAWYKSKAAELMPVHAESRGTFNAAEAFALGAGGNAVDRIAKATEETAKNTRKQNQQRFK